jgi:hypothetical protein
LINIGSKKSVIPSVVFELVARMRIREVADLVGFLLFRDAISRLIVFVVLLTVSTKMTE